MVDYDNLLQKTQEKIHSILTSNRILKNKVPSFVDGLPITSMQRGIGFPYIRIPTGLADEIQLTATKKKILIQTEVTAYSRNAKVLRETIDLVRYTLNTIANQKVAKDAGLYRLNIHTISQNESLANDKKPIYEHVLMVEYQWRGSL